MAKVLIIQKSLPQYRLEFFNQLKTELLKKNIELQLIYGDSHVDNRNDLVTSDWATYKKNAIVHIGKLSFIWQPCLKEIKSADLVIVEQANKLLINYILVFRRKINNKKFAFWGHGSDLQSPSKNLFNLFKLLFIKQSSWWFAYTQGVKNFLTSHGVKESNITIVQNAIDTKFLNDQYNSISNKEVEQLKTKYDIKNNEKVLIYCGALTKEKKIEFLIQSVDILYKKGFSVKLFIIGSGPYEEFIKHAIKKRSWLIYTGPKFDREKAEYFKLADLFLLPGAIGLAILDSFAFETPLVTTRITNHGPEFEYLINNENGIVSEPNINDYVHNVIALLENSEKIFQLKSSCQAMINKYNIECMVNNFVNGINKALEIK